MFLLLYVDEYLDQLILNMQGCFCITSFKELTPVREVLLYNKTVHGKSRDIEQY